MTGNGVIAKELRAAFGLTLGRARFVAIVASLYLFQMYRESAGASQPYFNPER
jgi:hypothetical protein